MRILVHIMIEDMGDGSHMAWVGPSKEALRLERDIGPDDYHLIYDYPPVEWDTTIIDVTEYTPVD